MSTIDTFAENLHGYLAPEQVAQVVRAYDFAEVAHEGQTRKSGEPYINHPLAVAQILADMRVAYKSKLTGRSKHTPQGTMGVPGPSGASGGGAGFAFWCSS